jgi:sterol desaturase/sphingolipid hydroxylase (fatty acid hydroxylase superfamily)
MHWGALCLTIGAGILLTYFATGDGVLFDGALKSIVDANAVKDALGSLGQPVYGAIEGVWGQFFATPTGPFYWGYLLLGLVVVYLLYILEKRGNAPYSSSLSSTGERRPPPTTFRSFLFPNGFLNRPHIRLDLFFFVTTTIVGTFANFLLVTVIVQDNTIHNGVISVLSALFESPAIEPTLPVRIVGSIIVVLAFDLQFYALHYWEHNTKLGWSIHQTHHSQTQLNVFTDDREHPIFPFVQAVVPAIFFMVPVAVLNFVVPGFLDLQVGHVGIGFALFLFLKAFRHSHVSLRFPRPVEWLFQSPAYHQVHHSSLPEHMNKNMGNMTTVWDRLFGTLHVPKPDESYRFGTGDEALDQAHTSIKYVYVDQTKTILKNLFSAVISPITFIAARLMPVRSRSTPTNG